MRDGFRAGIGNQKREGYAPPPDIIEGGDQVHHLHHKESTPLRFGTIDDGLGIGSQVWPQGQYVFSIGRTDLQDQVPGRPRADVWMQDTHADPNLMGPTDVWCVDGPSSDWWQWFDRLNPLAFPSAIVWMVDASMQFEDSWEDRSRAARKRLEPHGYKTTYWLLSGDDYSAAISQERVAMVFYQGTQRPDTPQPHRLPPRPMSNMLMFSDIPNQAWVQDMSRWTPSDVPSHPSLRYTGRVDEKWVHSIDGSMPDQVGAWIHTPRGIRELQAGEIAKAKGVDKEWRAAWTPTATPAIASATSIQLWTAVLDPVAQWLRTKADGGAETASRSKSTGHQPGSSVGEGTAKGPSEGPKPSSSPSGPPTTDDPGLKADGPTSTPMEKPPKWDWKPPDLRPNRRWHRARVRNLKRAIKGRADADKLFEEGLEALRVHRQNYTDEGPKFLQLLWWEFPKEHWDAVRIGSSMNFLILPSGQLALNSDMDEEQLAIACQFVDELIDLGVLVPAGEPLEANAPLFCVPKPGQPGQWRCIADMKAGGQNACIGKDPCYLYSPEDILPRMYTGGYTAIADASKFFYNFPTRPEERKYLGCIHPRTGQHLYYAGCPMGSANSPAATCRLGNSVLRLLREESSAFQGTPVENTWRKNLAGGEYHPEWGHGRVNIGPDGTPAALVWGHVDDYMVHAPHEQKCQQAFTDFMDLTVRMGMICQAVKTQPPAQRQKYCGFIYDSTATPTLFIPDSKLSKSRCMLEYLFKRQEEPISRLGMAIMGGTLQSLVPATPQRIGQTYLRSTYEELHDSKLFGKALYYSTMRPSSRVWDDLGWWWNFLGINSGARSRTGTAGSLVPTWGDGSGTGTGGTRRVLDSNGEVVLRTWMGTWAPHVAQYSSNWRELRTLLHTLERELRRDQVQGATLFYFTDNLVTYFVTSDGSSRSPALHALIRRIKELEVELGCRLETIHVPGELMIQEGTDGLSRGMWLSLERLPQGINYSELVLSAVHPTPALRTWLLETCGYPAFQPYHELRDMDSWAFHSIAGHLSMWFPAPEIARQAISHFLTCWVEAPTDTSAIFAVPRAMQREWGHVSRHVHQIGTFHPSEVPGLHDCVLPLVVLHVRPHVRMLDPDRVELPTRAKRFDRWHLDQAEALRGLS